MGGGNNSKAESATLKHELVRPRYTKQKNV